MRWHKNKISPNRATPEDDYAIACRAYELGPICLTPAATILGCGASRLARIVDTFGVTNVAKAKRRPNGTAPKRSKIPKIERGFLVFMHGKSVKKCPGCLEIKEAHHFNTDSYNAHGLRARCRMCEKLARAGIDPRSMVNETVQ